MTVRKIGCLKSIEAAFFNFDITYNRLAIWESCQRELTERGYDAACFAATSPSLAKARATSPQGEAKVSLRPNLALSILRSALSLATFLFDPRGAKRKVSKRETRFGETRFAFLKKSSAKNFPMC